MAVLFSELFSNAVTKLSFNVSFVHYLGVWLLLLLLF